MCSQELPWDSNHRRASLAAVGGGAVGGGGQEAGFQPFPPASIREVSLLSVTAPPSTLIFKEVFTVAAIKQSKTK